MLNVRRKTSGAPLSLGFTVHLGPLTSMKECEATISIYVACCARLIGNAGGWGGGGLVVGRSSNN